MYSTPVFRWLSMQASIYYFVMQESFPNFVIQAPFRQVLSNGLTLVHRPDFASPVVSLQLWVKTGSLHEGAYLGSGISHYIEHLVFKGTERRTGPMINRAIHALGGSINAYTTFDRTVYYIDAPAAAFDTALDLLTDLVFHAKLEAEAIELERQVILREIDMGLDDPDQQLSQLLLRTAYSRHPYRFPIIGGAQFIRSYQRRGFAQLLSRTLCAKQLCIGHRGRSGICKLFRCSGKVLCCAADGFFGACFSRSRAATTCAA